MARIRTIKPELFLSETLAQVSLAAERTFTGLITQADDRGRCRYNAAVLNGALWPLRPEHTPEDFAQEVDDLVEVGALCKYEVDGKAYLHFPTWEGHQKISHPSTRTLGPPCPHHDGHPHLAQTGVEIVPADPYGTDDSGKSPEDYGKTPKGSGESPQGSGSGRGKGSGTGSGSGRGKKQQAAPAPAAAEPEATKRGRPASRAKSAPTAQAAENAANAVVAEFSNFTHGMVNAVKVKAVVLKATSAGYEPDAVLAALKEAHEDGKPLLADVLHQYLEGYAQKRKQQGGKSIHYAADRPTAAAEYSEDL